MAWAKCWFFSQQRGPILVHNTQVWARTQTLFLVLAPVTGLYAQCRSDGLSILYSLCSFFSPHTYSEKLHSIKEKTDSSVNKALQSCGSHCTVFLDFLNKAAFIHRRSFQHTLGKKTMTKQDCRMTQSLLAVGGIQI